MLAMRSITPPGAPAAFSQWSWARRIEPRRFQRVRSSQALRFSPTWWQFIGLDALAGAASVALATWLRFVDEFSIPTTYVVRLVPWLVLAALIQVGVGRLIDRLRRPGSPLARRPVAPFLVAGLVALGVTLLINDLVLREPWRLPHFVAVVGPLLATAASVALRLAAGRTIEPEELLPRRSVSLDLSSCAPVLRGKRVLITGAAGSIGSELTRQVLGLEPELVLAVDMNETGLYELEAGLGSHGTAVRTCIADVADERRIRELLARERPHVIFHAAAYKHVPLVEANPDQGFVSNVLGTLIVCDAALTASVERVVIISTDKAVNPSSFMGLTKRVAELIVAAISQQAPPTSVFSAVRFGNVLGSRGSFVPLLLRQIESGGPVTITDPEARRFFMTISEAASLLLLSAAHGSASGVFVLEMGDDVRITDLAERLAQLKGVRLGRDVAVQHIGLRPGEKLREELYSADERIVPTEHPAVQRVEPDYVVDGPAVLSRVRALDVQRRSGSLAPSELPQQLRDLIESTVSQNQVQIAELVPEVPAV
jgi:nucleoside-diphosphate-sugar epimerase